MDSTTLPTKQYLAGKFLLSAGSVLFRYNASHNRLEVCILYHLRKHTWVLPKGRKDRGETMEKAAVRETFEETGYRCVLWPQRMLTRAPAPGDNVHDAQAFDGLVEPIAVTVRDLGAGRGIKQIWWYITRVVGDGTVKVEGSQMDNEAFSSVFVEPRTALARLTSQCDREVMQQAIDIVGGFQDTSVRSFGCAN